MVAHTSCFYYENMTMVVPSKEIGWYDCGVVTTG